ncbi:MAG: phosphate acyltransferase PlsX [Anaerolineae bacterium]|nr:MAG: phosphate acyltransferase PlsX [Anaerolineae bacterium]WKZ45473.1 MAG: phosphate acyltransferase PlsX [Anaerolineales bacterium]
MTRIVVDAMGSDNYPAPDVEGAIAAAREYGVEIILTGDASKIQPLLDSNHAGNLPIRVIHAPEMLTMKDKGEDLVMKARHKDAQNSMAVGYDLVKNGEADAFVTAGNTGAAMVTALFRLGRIKGVDRPAIAPPFPTAEGFCIILDIGANPDCKPENLLQFAIMGSVYAERVRGVKNPRVGLISNGEEAGKGSELVKMAYPLLKNANLNFVGNLEGKEIFGGHADVAVTDGFTGNVLLKSTEAVAKLLIEKIRESIKGGGLLAMIGGALIRPAMGKVRKLLDPAEEGAAPLLGVNGLVFIGHGRSDSFAVKNSIRVAKEAAESKVLDAMKSAIEESLKK